MNCTRKHRCFDLRSLLLWLAKPPNVWSNKDRAKMKKGKSQKQLTRGIAYKGWEKNKTNKQTKSHTPDQQVCKLQLQFSPPPNDGQDYKWAQKKSFSKEEEKNSLNSSAFFPSIDTSNKQWECYLVSIVITYKYHHEEVRPWRRLQQRDHPLGASALTRRGDTKQRSRRRDSVCVYDSEFGVFILAEVNAQVLPSPLLPSSPCFCSINDANAGITYQCGKGNGRW